MKTRLLLLSFFSAGMLAHGVEPLFKEDFEKAEIGRVPQGALVLSGGFAVREEGGKKFLELPGSPLDTFGMLFGANEKPGISASAKCFGTKQGRKFPTFGVSVQGVGGYRLQVSPAKKALEIYQGDEPRAQVPFVWQSGTWTSLRVQIRSAGAGKWIVEGKAWPAEAPEPESWTISFETGQEPATGRSGIWGSPFSGDPIRFDDLVVAPAA